MINNKYLVGVRCFTYNQSKYILDALNGFVMQQTNFPFVVMVVDDASTDGEQEVIRNFVAEQFDIADTNEAYEKETDYAHITYAQHNTNKNCYIVAMYLKENHYSQRKAKLPYLSEWRDYVKYEALCEGDDYWIDSLKLQKQVEFMEENDEYGLVYGKSKSYIQVKNEFGGIIGGNVSDFEELILFNNIPTLTVLYRMAARENYSSFVSKSWLMGDYPLWLYIANNYKIHFIEDVFSVYRILEKSASHSNDYDYNKKFIFSTYDIRIFFCKKLNKNSLIPIVENVKNQEIFRLAYNSHRYDEIIKNYSFFKERTIKNKIKYLISFLKYHVFHN